VGRISRGFDFLGDDFSPAGMTGMSRRTVEKAAGDRHLRSLKYTELRLDGRNRFPDLVEERFCIVDSAPVVDVAPIQSIVALNGDDVANVLSVLFAFGDTCPAEFHNNDIFHRRDLDGGADLLGDDRASALEALLIVWVFASIPIRVAS
jgi:hypothetical protein